MGDKDERSAQNGAKRAQRGAGVDGHRDKGRLLDARCDAGVEVLVAHTSTPVTFKVSKVDTGHGQRSGPTGKR